MESAIAPPTKWNRAGLQSAPGGGVSCPASPSVYSIEPTVYRGRVMDAPAEILTAETYGLGNLNLCVPLRPLRLKKPSPSCLARLRICSTHYSLFSPPCQRPPGGVP